MVDGKENMKFSSYPLVICYIAIENGHEKWIFPLKMVIFNGYVTNYQRAR
jgi:hypothetical protein